MKQETKIITKLFIVALMLIGGGNSAWGENVTIFGGTVASGWTYKNNAGTNMSVTADNELYDGGGTFSPRAYTSTSNFTISSDQTIKIVAKRSSASLAPNIKVKYSSDSGSSWTQAKEFTSTEINSISDYAELFVDSIVGSYYIQFEFTYVYIKSIILEDNDPNPTPSDFVVSSVTGTSATLSWTQAKDETAWRIRYSTKSDFDPETEGATIDYTYDDSYSYTLSGLTGGVRYYAYITANYGKGQYSTNWSSKIDFLTGESFTINNNSANNSSNVPFPNNTNKSDYLTKSQILLPYSDISTLKGKSVEELTFYATTSSISWGTATYDIYLAETTFSGWNYSNQAFIDWREFECVATGVTPEVKDGKLTLEISPYLYKADNNENLVIGIVQTAASLSNVSSSWYGVNNYSPYCGAAYYNDGTEKQAYQSLRPKLTIKYFEPTVPVTLGTNGYTTFACPRPLDLTAANLPTGLKVYKAAVDGDKVKFTEINQAVPANTGVLLEGEAGETYNIPVAESGTAPEGNKFLVNSTGGTFAATEGYTYFGMKKATLASDAIVFATFKPSTVAIPTNKAYLKVLKSSLPSAARQLVCTFDDDTTTGIKAIGDMQQTKGSYYNLAGQRVSKPSKGLYIVDGKKVIMK